MFFPYQLGMIAALDRDGRPMILANAVAGVGSGVGPLIVSFFLVGDFLPAYKIAALFLFFALSLAVLVITISKKDVKA
jgi:hypothetical protein